MTTVIQCNDLDEALEHHFNRLGYRLDMITPADAPREALMSKYGESLRLVASPKSNVPSPESRRAAEFGRETLDLGPTSESEWIVGRAGMEYRDLIPERLGGRVIASHIRIPDGGEVADYVHYHKVKIQMIYCLKGAIHVVYEDQGKPFWLNPGDCVLQPPEIRHRVLEAEAGSEVIEITSPAEHETWFDHELQLPTAEIKPDREFGEQQFVRYEAQKADWISTDSQGSEVSNTKILDATKGIADVKIFRWNEDHNGRSYYDPGNHTGIQIGYVLGGSFELETEGFQKCELNKGACFNIPGQRKYTLASCGKSNLLLATINI